MEEWKNGQVKFKPRGVSLLAVVTAGEFYGNSLYVTS